MHAQQASFEWLDAQEEWERYSAPLTPSERTKFQSKLGEDAAQAIVKSQIGIEGM